MSDLGAEIRDARKAAGLTQSDVADKLKVSIQAISQWETNKTTPSFKNLRDLSKIINLKVYENPVTRSVMMDPALSFSNRPAVKAPLVPWNAPGDWAQLDLDWDNLDRWYPHEFLEVRWAPVGEVYALRLENSLLAPDFVKGDDIIIDTGRAPEKGDIVVAQVEGAVTWGRYIPLGVDKHRAPIFEVQHNLPNISQTRVDTDKPGHVIGVVREHRRYYRSG
jgi:transcriptional regulator with XRE-family HTH domain